MDDIQHRNEVQESLRAANRALCWLEKVEEALESAERWGVFDLLGGGVVSTLIKQDHINGAEQAMNNAKQALFQLKNQLESIGNIPTVQIQIEDYLRFADCFFDGVIVDWIVQSRIQESKNAVKKVKYQVIEIRKKLLEMEK